MKQKDRWRTILRTVILILLAAVLILLAVEVKELRETDRTYGEIVKKLGKEEDLPRRHEDNSEVIAWLTVDGTAISVPVTQAKDNIKYLNTDVAGEQSFAGNPFLDFRNRADFSDVYSVIYGHHMEEHLMFGDLDLCMEDAFWEGPCTGTLRLTDGRELSIRFFAAVRTEDGESLYFDPLYEANNWDEEHLKELTDNAVIAKESVTPEDRVLALSTCEEADSSVRILLLGKLAERR